MGPRAAKGNLCEYCIHDFTRGSTDLIIYIYDSCQAEASLLLNNGVSGSELLIYDFRALEQFHINPLESSGAMTWYNEWHFH